MVILMHVNMQSMHYERPR